MERLAKRGEKQKFPSMFAKYSKNYLVDETMPPVILNQSAKNNLEFYYFGQESMHTEVFRGKKAKNNEVIQSFVNGDLFGITNRQYITIKDKTV